MELYEMQWPKVQALPRSTPIVFPIAALEQHGHHMPVFTDSLLLGEVAQIDTEIHHVTLDDGAQFSYDYLVLATGARHSYFGHPEWERLAPGLKSLADALELRRRIFLAFELAEARAQRHVESLEHDPAKRIGVVAGGHHHGGQGGAVFLGIRAQHGEIANARHGIRLT